MSSDKLIIWTFALILAYGIVGVTSWIISYREKKKLEKERALKKIQFQKNLERLAKRSSRRKSKNYKKK